MSLDHEKVVVAFFDGLMTEDPAENASRNFAEDGKFFEQVGLPGIQGRANIKAFLEHVLPQLGNFRYEMITIGSTGNRVFFERVERSMLTEIGARPGYPAGTPLSLHIAGVAEVDAARGEITEWYDFWTLPTLQKHSAIPEGMPSIPWVVR